MGVHIDDVKLEISETKTFHFHFDLHTDVDKNLKHNIDSIIKQ